MGSRRTTWPTLLAISAVFLLSVPLILGCGTATPPPDDTTGLQAPDAVAAVPDERIATDLETGEVYVRDEALVYLDPSMTATDWDTLLDSVGGTVVGGVRGVGLFQVRMSGVTSRAALDDRLAALGDHPHVALAVPNLVVREPESELEESSAGVRRVTNDPEHSWGTSGSIEHWQHVQSGVVDAWDSVTGSSKVRIGVVDFNLPVDHPDLMGNITNKTSYDANFGGQDHGIQTCGVIAAVGNNATGVTGVCWDADVRYYDVSNPSGQAPWSAVIAGFVSAAEAGCRVVSFSGGSWVGISSGPAYMNLLRPVVKQMGKLDTILCASAGNDSNDAMGNTFKGLGSDPTLTNVLIVGGLAPTEWDGTSSWGYELADYSNYGPSVGVCAPGSEIITTTGLGGVPGYGLRSGTGIASAYVTGVLGLLVAANPDLTAQQLRDTIIDSATETVAGPDGVPMAVLDADAALAEAPGTGLPVAVLKASGTSFDSVPATVTFDPRASSPGVGSTISSWSLDFGDGSGPKTGSSAPALTIVHEYTASGVYTAQLTVGNTAGKTDTRTLAIGVGVGTLPVIID